MIIFRKCMISILSSKIDTAKDIENIVLVNKQVVDGIDYLFLKNHMQHRVA